MTKLTKGDDFLCSKKWPYRSAQDKRAPTKERDHKRAQDIYMYARVGK